MTDEPVVAPLQAADAATDGQPSLIEQIRAARLRDAGPLPAISEESIQYILSAVHELPMDALKFVSGGTPRAGELWRAGKHEALLMWVRKVFDDGVVDAVPVVLDFELADEESVLIPADATPLACELAAMTAIRSHLSADVFLNFMCALDIGAEIEEVMQATREGRKPVNVLVGPPICDDTDRRIEYRCAIRDVLGHMSPGATNAAPERSEPRMTDPMERALRLLESCQMPGFDPENAETYPAVEDGGVNSIVPALAAAQVLASLAVADELRRLNEGRDQWYREVLDLLSQAKDPEGSLRSGQPAAAPGCPVCGNVNVDDGEECLFGDITRTEWLTHRQHFFERALSFRTEYGAGLYADQRMRLDFGPCPEES